MSYRYTFDKYWFTPKHHKCYCDKSLSCLSRYKQARSNCQFIPAAEWLL